MSAREVEQLQARVAHLRPKVAAAARLKATLVTLEAQASEAKSLQVRGVLLFIAVEKAGQKPTGKWGWEFVAGCSRVCALEDNTGSSGGGGQEAAGGSVWLFTAVRAKKLTTLSSQARAADLAQLTEKLPALRKQCTLSLPLSPSLQTKILSVSLHRRILQT